MSKKTKDDDRKILARRMTGSGADLVFSDDARFDPIGDGEKAPKEPDLEDDDEPKTESAPFRRGRR
jgi:hypothetical protein